MRFLPNFWLLAAAGTLHAADPVISEFMADNTRTLADQDAQFPDWIEVYNPGPAAVDLNQWSLTDDAAALTKWRFPSHALSAGQSVVVFASAKNRAVAGQQLHTSFELNNGGEYLALVKPDGTTKTSEWNPFPAQPEDVSYGSAQQVITTSVVNEVNGKAFVPAGSGPAAGWNTAAYVPDAAWITTLAPPGIGYDLTAAVPPASNIAPSGTATQSTTSGANAAALAQDNLTTNYSQTLGTDALPFWLVDFGADATINSVTLRNRTDCCGSRLRDITITILNASMTPVWTSALLNPENTGFTYPAGPASLTVDLVALTGAPVTGRHVRVSRTADPDLSGTAGQGTLDEQNVLALGEVEVMGNAPGTLVNLARTGSPLPIATQTSTLSTFTAALAIDGLNTNFTHTLNTDLNPTWTINLNRRAAISRVHVHNREACCPERLRDITVLILDTNGTTVLHTSALLNPSNSLGSPADLVYDVAAANGGNPIAGQYVRIRRTPDVAGGATDDARVLSMGEVQVRGTELNGYRPYIRTDVQTPMLNLTPAAYLRLPFSVANPSSLTGLSLRMRYDDGVAVFLNGAAVVSRNAPAGAIHTSVATAHREFTEGIVAETIDLSPQIGLLAAGGGNVLALHGMNSAAGDDNFLLQPELITSHLQTTPNVYLTNATPGTVNSTTWYIDEVNDTVYSHRRGFYDNPFSLAITSTTPDAQIYYSTDNSEPTIGSTPYTAPLLIDKTTVVRARAFKTNWKPTNIDTHTFIFLAAVTSQPKVTLSTAGAVGPAGATVPAGWPNNAATNGGQAFNWGFTPSVIAAYTPAQVREALTQIPTMSIVTQQNNLTNPLTGIYVNGINHGVGWERPASLEMLDITKPGATPEAGHGEFGENCGLRIRGGASRADSYIKHSFRIFFRREYGNGKLNYRLFGSEGAAEYENFDVRSDQNYAWSNNAGDAQCTMVRDPWSRDAFGAMGQPYTRSRFVHLYLNGLYWGVYEIHERPENSYAETYLGGDKDDYDVIKNHDRHSGTAFSTEATDGYLQTLPDGSKAAWRDLWERCLALPAAPSNANYFRILGRNPDGTRNPAYPVLLDVDNLIDYMMILFYTGDGDACLSGFLSFNQPNNWHGVRDRNGTRGFVFFNHDTEHTLRASNWVGSRGRVDAFGAPDHTGPYGGSNQPNFTFSNPQWMHEELMSNAEYRLRFADHVRRHLFNNGALTPGPCTDRWTSKTAPLTNAITMHAGRWASSAGVITTWTRLCVGPNGAGVIDNVPGDFFPSRHTDLLNMLKVDGLYPALNAPDYSQHGGSVPAAYQLNITAPAGATIYYTLDGSDPRAIQVETPTPFTFLPKTGPWRYRVTTGATDGFSGLPVNPPSPGPVSRYALDGNANDAVGGNNGTLNNAPVFVSPGADGTGQCISLNGTNQAINLGNPVNLQITGQITMAAWIRPTSAPALRNILNKGHNTTPSGENTLRIDTGNTLAAGSWNGTNYMASAGNGFTINQWQHVCGVYNGTQWILYRNGQQLAAATHGTGAVAVAGAAAANNVWNIGSRGGSPTERAFPGQIDDVQIYNRGLQPAEVFALATPGGTLYTADWKEPAFSVPAGWGTGNGGHGYDTEATVAFAPFIVTDLQASMQNTSSTLLMRSEFALTPAQISNTAYLQLNARYDDGFVAYLNGVKIAERNAPAGNFSGASAATAVRADADAIVQEKINVSAFISSLAAGNNVLAIHGLNTTAADNDFLMEAELVAGPNTASTSPSAQLYTGPITLNSPVTVSARVYQNGTWSALTQAFFSVATEPASASNTVVSEVHYNPENPSLPAELAVSPDKDDYEFVEVMNISASSAVDMTNTRFTAGITTSPTGNAVLQPGERAVFVKHVEAFNLRYASVVPAPRVLGTFSGSLSNQGEQIILNAAGGAVIRNFEYDDNAPWPEDSDGTGMSLSLIAPLSNPDHQLPQNWRGSSSIGGTPGGTDALGFAAWKATHGILSNSEDGDRDGQNAILEYTLRGSPAVPDYRAPIPGISADGFLTFALTHAPNADDVNLVPETSTNLTAWSAAGISFMGRTRNPDGTITTRWKAPAAVAAGPHLYFHVNAVLR